MAADSGRNKRYALPPAAAERFRLLSWPRIAAFTALIVAVMAWLYPRDQLVERVAQAPSQDALNLSYLDNLIKAEPDNIPLQIKRAEFHAQAGDYRTAEDLLRALDRKAMQQQAPQATRIEIAHALIGLRERQAFALPPARRHAYLPELRQALAALAALDIDARQREQLAAKAIAYGAPELAVQLYRDLAKQAAPHAATDWLERAARAALSMQRYREAAALYFEARHAAPTADRQKAFFLAGVRALQAGNLPTDALAAAEREAGALIDDADILIFMIERARAANRNDRAEWYVKKLLRYAHRLPAHRLPWMQARHADPDFDRVQHAADRQAPPLRRESPTLSGRLPGCGKTGAQSASSCWQRLPGIESPAAAPFILLVNLQPQLPFDDRIYRLGYEVFLANRNLADAYALAASAVRQAPDSAAWRERYAQVAEWHGQPTVALAQWRALALQHDSETAWQALLRLAPGLFDEETVALALMRESRRGRLDDARLNRLVQAFEGMGEAQQGVAFLNQAYREKPRRALLVKAAWLEERMGQVSQAIASLRRLQQRHGLDADEARQLAALLISQGELGEAYQVLSQHKTLPAAKNREYQALLAELAWRVQDKRAAKQLYQQLYARHTLEEHETERLILLLRDASPDAAARLATRTWMQRRIPRFLLTALSLHLAADDLPAANALLASLTAADLATLEKQTGFLQQRADVHRRNQRMAAAVQDMQRAVQLMPDNASLNAQLLWLLIEARDTGTLAQELARRHPRALDEPALWAPMGAGYALLSQARQALPYYAKQAAARREDYLWQIAYAQLLEQTGQQDMAWRLRRHAWLNLRQAQASARDTGQRQALAQLALRFAPGDAGMQWLREWLRQDRSATQSHSAEARELATAWYLSQEQHESARIWLLQQYGKQLQAPRWAEAALALQGNDRAALEKIVAGDGEGLDPATRAEAAMRLDAFGAAYRIASAGRASDPDNEVLHLQQTESLWQLQNRAGLRFQHEETGALRIRGWRVDGQWHVTPRLKMGLALTDDRLASTDATQLSGLPDRDFKLALSAALRHDTGETRMQVFHREALQSVFGLQLGHQLKLDRRLQLGATLGYQLNADETAALRAGGMKDTLKLDANWQISKREYLLAEFSASRYFGQDRVSLGQGGGLELQLGHRIRTEYPDITLKLLGGVYRFDAAGTTGSVIHALLPAGTAVLPAGFNRFGFGLGLGETAAEQFSRAWRPYASLDVSRNSETGWGYGLEFGFVVSPSGHDWLRGRVRNGSNSFDGADSRLFDLEYRYLF